MQKILEECRVNLLGAEVEALDVTHCNEAMLQQLFGCDPFGTVKLKHLLQQIHEHQQIQFFGFLVG